jgi:hypothetical protein
VKRIISRRTVFIAVVLGLLLALALPLAALAFGNYYQVTGSFCAWGGTPCVYPGDRVRLVEVRGNTVTFSTGWRRGQVGASVFFFNTIQIFPDDPYSPYDPYQNPYDPWRDPSPYRPYPYYR